MKKGIVTSLILSAALAFLASACSQTANVNTSPTVDHNSMAMSSDATTEGMSEMKSSPNAASQPYDLQFIDTMTTHHKSAVEMADVVLNNSANEELKQFAQNIITNQNNEIEQMNEWREKWFAGKPAAMNTEMAGMSESMKSTNGDNIKKWVASSGKDFDLIFLDMMTPHHTGAVAMAKEALTKAEHAEIKKLAQNIINAQEAEIKQMTDWKSTWSK